MPCCSTGITISSRPGGDSTSHKMFRLVQLSLLLTLALPSSGAILIPSSPPRQVAQTSPDTSIWQRFTPEGEEFSILVPVQPSVMIESHEYVFSEGGEPVKERRFYSGYYDGFAFVIESLKAARTQRLLKSFAAPISGSIPEETTISGTASIQYKIATTRMNGYVYRLATNRHVYIITGSSRVADHPALAKFISSLESHSRDCCFERDSLGVRENARLNSRSRIERRADKESDRGRQEP